MCTVSMLYDYGRNRFPNDYWTPVTWPYFTELVKQAEDFDKKTDQPDCVDPAKEEWAKQVEERLRRLESEPLPAGQPDWEVG